MSHTAGPWRWVLSETGKIVRLEGGVPRYDLTVVDFVRYGMGKAAPRFRENVERMNIMHRCEKWAVKVPGREHHANWFKTLDHPDAHLIAAAPDLLEALRGLLADIQDYQRINNLGGENNHWQVIARAALAKAEGTSFPAQSPALPGGEN